MFRHQSRREAGYRKHVSDASPVRTAAGRAQADDGPPHTSCVGPSKPALQPRGENTGPPLRGPGPAACRHLPVICPASSGDALVPFTEFSFLKGRGSSPCLKAGVPAAR